MSKIVKAIGDQTFAMECDRGTHSLLIVGGPRPYLWFGLSGESGRYVTSITGDAELRQLRDALTVALSRSKP